MVLVAASDLEVGVPDLDSSIPTHRAEVGGVVLQHRGVSDTAHPVLMVAFLRGELVLSSGVPQLDTLISSSRDNLSVIRGEGAGQDFLIMSLEESSGLEASQVPQSHGLIPRGTDQEAVVIG